MLRKLLGGREGAAGAAELPRLGLARVASALGAATAVRVGPLDYTTVDEPELPGPGWHRVRTRLAGHLRLRPVDDRRTRLDVLRRSSCRSRSCPATRWSASSTTATGSSSSRCSATRPAASLPRSRAPLPVTATTTPTSPPDALEPGIQTGFCCSTGGGWAPEFVAHETQLHRIDADMPDERAVLVEPFAGGIHAALLAADGRLRRGRRRARSSPCSARARWGWPRSPACAATCPTYAIIVGARYAHQQAARQGPRRRRRRAGRRAGRVPCGASTAVT